MCDVLQDDNSKSDSSTNRTQKEDRPVKKLRFSSDVQPVESLHLPYENMDVCATATDAENMQFVVDLTASNDSEISPRSPVVAERLSIANNLPPCLPKSELCLTDDKCTCRKQRQLCSENGTLSPPTSPKLRTGNIDRNSHEQSVNGIRDVSLLKTQYQSAAMIGCHDRVTDELTTDCHSDLIVQINGFPSLEPAVAGGVVNGESVVQDCSL